jgi:hypothetical protein
MRLSLSLVSRRAVARMREIGKYRGKRLDNGEWIYGDYVRFPRDSGSWMEPPSQEEDHFITNRRILSRDMMKVDPSTVGEFTGLCDKNGVEIYEGDILRDPITGNIRQIFYHPPAFILRDADSTFYWTYHADEYERIGNVWENPELLEEVIAKAKEGKADG